LRNLILLTFEDHKPQYDDDEFNLMVERGTKAWADVPDSTAWLEALRGSQVEHQKVRHSVPYTANSPVRAMDGG